MKASSVEFFFQIITKLSYLVILATPFVINIIWKSHRFLSFIFFSASITFFLSMVSIYWSEEFSNNLIFNFYGFNSYGMDESERWMKIIEIDDKKTILRILKNSFGVSWILKLSLIYAILIFPYTLLCCSVIYGFKLLKKGQNNNNINY